MNQQILQHFIDATNQLKEQNRYREFVDITRICNEFPFAINNKNKQKIKTKVFDFIKISRLCA